MRSLGFSEKILIRDAHIRVDKKESRYIREANRKRRGILEREGVPILEMLQDQHLRTLFLSLYRSTMRPHDTLRNAEETKDDVIDHQLKKHSSVLLSGAVIKLRF